MNSADTFLKLKVILCCLLAPVFEANLMNAVSLAFDYSIGFEPVKITYFGVLGCYTEPWMSVASFFFFIPFFFGINYVAFWLSRKENINYKLLGAILLFGVIFRLAETVLNSVLGGFHPFSFIAYKEKFLQNVMPVFGTQYIFMWVKAIVYNGMHLFFLILCLRVVFRYWNKQLQLYFFTYGGSCGMCIGIVSLVFCFRSVIV